MTPERRLELMRRFGIDGPAEEPPAPPPEAARLLELVQRFRIPHYGAPGVAASLTPAQTKRHEGAMRFRIPEVSDDERMVEHDDSASE